MAEPLAIEFANTHYAVRGELREGIGTAPELDAWLRQHLHVDGVDEAAVAEFLALRDAIRALAMAAIDGEPAAGADLAVLNDAAAAAPRWPVLSADYTVAERTNAEPLRAARAVIARDAMRVLPSAELRACRAPGCVLFFIKDHPRREWCCGTCGNRARVARHYARHRASEGS